MKDQLDLQIERARREEKYFENWRHYAKKIKKAAQGLLGERGEDSLIIPAICLLEALDIAEKKKVEILKSFSTSLRPIL